MFVISWGAIFSERKKEKYIYLFVYFCLRKPLNISNKVQSLDFGLNFPLFVFVWKHKILLLYFFIDVC